MNDGHVDLPADATAPKVARSFVRAWMLERDLDALVDTVVLLTSEVVTNAVLHAAGPAQLSCVAAGEGVRVTVADASPVAPALRRHSKTSTTGRGVQLLVQLADDWGWDVAQVGKTVWFVVSSAPVEEPALDPSAWLDQAEL